jgi:hypothetical protein
VSAALRTLLSFVIFCPPTYFVGCASIVSDRFGMRDFAAATSSKSSRLPTARIEVLQLPLVMKTPEGFDGRSSG